LRVLYAEDSAQDADLTSRHLSRNGQHIRLEVVHSATECLQRLPSHAGTPSAWDVLLVDYLLPETNALQLLKILREERGLDLPIVLVTGWGDGEVAAQAYRSGATDYLVKYPGYLLGLPAVLEGAYHRVQLARRNAALQASEEALRLRHRVLRAVSEGTVICDPDFRVRYVNSAFERITGWSETELLGHNLSLLQGPATSEAMRDALRIALHTGQPFNGEILNYRKDGTTFWNEISIAPFRNERGEITEFVGVMRDVTESQRILEALRQSKEAVTAVLNAFPDAVFLLDTEGTVLAANEATAGRVNRSAQPVVGLCLYDLLPAKLVESRREWVREVIRTGEAILRQDPHRGQLFDYYLYPIKDPEGNVVRVVCHAQNVTALHAAEAALHLEHAAIETSLNAITFCTPRGGIHYVNSSFLRQFGYQEPAAVLGRSLFDLWERPEDAEVVMTAIAMTGRWTGELTPRRQGGTEATTQVSVHLVHDREGQPASLMASFMDITGRRQAEMALQSSRARMAGIIDSARDAIITVDDSHRVLIFNTAAEAIFGCPAAEALGQLLERFIPPDFDASNRGLIAHYGQSGEGVSAVSHPVAVHGRRADGTEFPGEATISRIEVDGYNLYTVILRDITERVRAEEERKVLEAQLRHAQKMDALGTLAGGIAHDFNNILTAVLGNVEMALLDVGIDHPVGRRLDEIGTASRRARDLVQQILAFSHQQQAPRRVIPLRPVVEEAVKMLRALLPAGVDLVTRLATDTPQVLAASTDIHQILMNLCTNAWHALDGRSGRIEVALDGMVRDAEAADGPRDLRPGRYARLTVSDTGNGMDSVTQARIFEPFFTTKGVGQGTGLGLSVVHGIVRGYGGAIETHSRLGEGATFVLYLPAAEAGTPTDPPPVAGPAPTGGGRRHVLYLDDEAPLVFLATSMLEELGYRVTSHTRPEAALEAFRAEPASFDLVITDVNMPGLSGIEVAREVLRLRPDLPVVLTSGYFTGELQATATDCGIRQVLYKPYGLRQLSEVVDRLMRLPERP
jgi:PAS domain S-box-containing protein